MEITINNFCALKKVHFVISEGINIIAGKNGAGKSQLLMAIAHRYGNQQLLNQYGFNNTSIDNKTVNISPAPKNVLWRPPIRKNAEENRNKEFAKIEPLDEYINIKNKTGYSYSVDKRYTSLHNRIACIYLAASVKNAKENNIYIWDTIQKSFNEVFNKKLNGIFEPAGPKVGIEISKENLTNFSNLSSGELEFICLMCDLLTEKDVDLFLIDEIDLHFHPDLQINIMKIIKNYFNNKIIIMTTHSPTIMCSVSKQNLFFLNCYSETRENENQIYSIKDDEKLYTCLTEINSSTMNYINELTSTNQDNILLNYAKQCFEPSEALPESSKEESDPQVIILRSLLLSKLSGQLNILEIGTGLGRLFTSFTSLADESLKKINYVGIEPNEKYHSIIYSHSIINKFNSFKICPDLDHVKDFHFDICILANVFHELEPLNIPNILNILINISNASSYLLILEVLKLERGEKNYVVFTPESINKIFEKFQISKAINYAYSKPKSFSGIPLSEILITINEPQKIQFNKECIKEALLVLVEQLSIELSEHITTCNMSLSDYAFKSHNIANASGYIKLI